MIARGAATLAGVMTALALSGCEDAGLVVPVTVEVSAALSLDRGAGERLSGEIVIDLEAPPGEEPVQLVLLGISVGAWTLAEEHLGGLDRFPDELAPGERQRVVLTVDHQVPPDAAVMAFPTCGGLAPGAPLQVAVAVLDVAVAEAGRNAGGPEQVVALAEASPTLVGAEPVPPLTMTSVFSADEGAVLAVDPDGGEEVLVVTDSGSIFRVGADGNVSGGEDLGLWPWDAARGGGVDAVVGSVAVDDPRCGPMGTDQANLAVMRLEGADAAWCLPIEPTSRGAIAVDATGTILVVEGGVFDDAQTLRRIGADGADLGSFAAPFPIEDLMAIPDGRVVGFGWLDPAVAVLDGDVVDVLSLGDVPVDELTLRPDGTIGFRRGLQWWSIDLDSGDLALIGPVIDSGLGPVFTPTELEGGDLLQATEFLGHGPPPEQLPSEGIALTLQRGGAPAWRGVASCHGGKPRWLPTTGSLRFLSVVVAEGGATLGGVPGGRAELVVVAPQE